MVDRVFRSLASCLLVGALLALTTSLRAASADTGAWTKPAAMPTARTGLAATTGPDGRIDAIGGCCDGNGNGLATVDTFTPATNRWTAIAPMSTGRAYLAATTGADGRLYAIGGCDLAVFKGPCIPLATVEAYHPSTKTWARRAPLPSPRKELAAATGPDGRLYVLGGCCDPATGVNAGGSLASVLAYTPGADTWAAVAPMAIARAGAAAVTGIDGRIYVIGGAHCTAAPQARDASHCVALDSVEAYSPATHRWVAVAPLPAPSSDIAATVGADGRIYAVNGPYDDAGGTYHALHSVDAYTPETNSWAVLTEVPTLRTGAAAARAPAGRIFVLGGTSSNADLAFAPIDLSVVEAYAPGASRPSVAPSACQFVLGFKTLHDLLPTRVGACLDNETHNPATGDAFQHTVGGLLVWRKHPREGTRNWTAFTDGEHTWVNGPRGLQERLNTQRFRWEANPDHLPGV